MQVTMVHIQIKAEHVQEFIAACRLNHEGSIREPGNRRFDILQSSNDPTRFVLYEAYASTEDAVAHKNTPHYMQWRDAVTPWMAATRVRDSYVGLFPQG